MALDFAEQDADGVPIKNLGEPEVQGMVGPIDGVGPPVLISKINNALVVHPNFKGDSRRLVEEEWPELGEQIYDCVEFSLWDRVARGCLLAAPAEEEASVGPDITLC